MKKKQKSLEKKERKKRQKGKKKNLKNSDIGFNFGEHKLQLD